MLSELQKAASSRSASSPSNTHFYSSSGGNAGLACVCAAVDLNSSATVVVPMSTSQYMIGKIRAAGAQDVIQHGKSWAEANAYLNDTLLPAARERGENAVFVPPFDSPEIWSGHATMVHEIAEQLAHSRPASGGRPDLIICSVGGGGLFNGIMQGLQECGLDGVPVLAVETNGAHSLAHALDNRKLMPMDAITSIATSLGAKEVTLKTFQYSQQPEVRNLVLDDKDAVRGCLDLAEKHRILVEAACGVAVAAAGDERVKELYPRLTEKSNVVVIVCGGSNVSLDLLDQYKKDYDLGSSH